MSVQILVAVLACDYAKTSDGRRNGHNLGPKSIARLDKALEFAAAQSGDVRFVFSAGKLRSEDARLCDLQAAYVGVRRYSVTVPPLPVQIWGSKPELQFFADMAISFPTAKLVIVSEDYHQWRLRKLAQSLGMQSAKIISVSSLHNPPSFGDLVHEVLGVGEVFLPTAMVTTLKGLRHRRLRRNLKP